MNFKKYHVSKNLFDGEVEQGTFNPSNGHEDASDKRIRTTFGSPLLSGTYTIDADGVSEVVVYAYAQSSISSFDINSSQVAWQSLPYTFNLPDTRYVRFAFRKNSSNPLISILDISNIMLNSGSEALPYEPYGNSWHDIPCYIHNTSADIIANLPAVLYPTGTTATVGLKGQAVQSTTPAPDNPIMPQGCGNMTGNLANLYNVDKSALSLRLTTSNNMNIVINGTKTSGSNVINIAYPNIVLPAGTYTVTIKMVGGTITGIESGAFFGINGNTYAQRTTPYVNKIGDVGRRTFTLPEDTLLSTLDITPSYGDVGSVWNNAKFECMLYSGSDDVPYEPYGVKASISSASTTTPVYLGEVESIRRIKQLVLDGAESWSEGASNYYIYINISGRGNGVPNLTALSTHTESGVVANNNGTALFFKKSVFVYPSLTDFKAYLAQQYANGTPVTVWYVLATEETGIVNEPLMKIGDYADTLSNVSIPVIAGGDTLSVGTTVQPSEVTVNYKGWHPVQNVHERNNGAWT